MKQVKSILKRIFFLPPLPTLCIALPSFALVIYVLDQGSHGPLAYAVYVLSAYALVISITGGPDIITGFAQWIKAHPLTRKMLRIPLVKRFAEDVRFRTSVSLYQGLLVNLLYIALKLTSGIYYRSWWFITLAAYYALLAVMRFLLLWRWGGIGPALELHRYRLCGAVLLIMNVALAGMVILMVSQNHGYVYPGILIYAMALYSFYTVILAVINVIKFRAHGSPVLSAAKAINLAAALVSILALETAMIAQFGGGDDYRRMMTAATGGGVCAIVLSMAVFMIVWSTKHIKQLEIQND